MTVAGDFSCKRHYILTLQIACLARRLIERTYVEYWLSQILPVLDGDPYGVY